MQSGTLDPLIDTGDGGHKLSLLYVDVPSPILGGLHSEWVWLRDTFCWRDY